MNLPKYAVSVKSVILKDNKLLLIKKLRKGEIDFGLLKREVKEELGIDIEIKRLLFVKKV